MQAKPHAFNPAELASAPSHGEACSFAAVSDEPSRLPVVGDSVFCLPLGLWLECSNAQMGPTNSSERKKHRPAPTPLNEMHFLPHGPIVRVESNEARSVVETPSGLLDAIHVLFRADRLSFVQAVAPYFAGHDAFRRLRDTSLVATRFVGRDASFFGNCFVWCLWCSSERRAPCASSWPRLRRSERLRPSATRQIQ